MERNKSVILAIEAGYKIDKDGKVKGKKGNFLSDNPVSTHGYKVFAFRIAGKRTKITFHCLQAYTKFGDAIFGKGIQIRHLDGVKNNNAWDNIEIGTQSDNQMDISPEDRSKRSSNPKHDHTEIVKDSKNGMSYRQIMKKHNISSVGTISFIVKQSMHVK
jgi:hypothetical protein